jgi:hypothetical protein
MKYSREVSIFNGEDEIGGAVAFWDSTRRGERAAVALLTRAMGKRREY